MPVPALRLVQVRLSSPAVTKREAAVLFTQLGGERRGALSFDSLCSALHSSALRQRLIPTIGEVGESLADGGGGGGGGGSAMLSPTLSLTPDIQGRKRQVLQLHAAFVNQLQASTATSPPRLPRPTRRSQSRGARAPYPLAVEPLASVTPRRPPQLPHIESFPQFLRLYNPSWSPDEVRALAEWAARVVEGQQAVVERRMHSADASPQGVAPGTPGGARQGQHQQRRHLAGFCF